MSRFFASRKTRDQTRTDQTKRDEDDDVDRMLEEDMLDMEIGKNMTC